MPKLRRPKFIYENEVNKSSHKSDASQSQSPSKQDIPTPSQQSKRQSKSAPKQINKNKQKKKQKTQQKAKQDESIDSIQFEEEKEKAKEIQKLKIQNPNESRKSENTMKTQIIKGKCSVDETFPHPDKYHVLVYKDKLYDCLMNQTNIVGSNNNNKFYIVQILESDDLPNKYFFLSRWGRIGSVGQKSIKQLPIFQAIDEFDQKVYDKNISGNYKIIHKQYANLTNDLSVEEQYNQSELHSEIKNLIKMIFDLKMMDKMMMEIGYDSAQMPLGQLASETINKGYEVLQKISSLLKISDKKKQYQLELLSSEFYSHIPHNYGFQKAPVISTNEQIKSKLEMLASLEQIQIATKIIKDQEGNMFDNSYEKLNTKINYVEPNSEAYEMIKTYIKNTHASTHKQYELEIDRIFELDKDLDNKRFKDVGNRMLLWHGSRLTNFVGILSQGLRIAPPEAPVTGYMFGKGIYFADMVSKSANYCGASRDNPQALILLCEVSLGDWQDRFCADYHANLLAEGKWSTRGVGKTAPSKSINFMDMQVPLGEAEKVAVKESDLLYNEYIVYDVKQIKLRYLINTKLERLMQSSERIESPSNYIKKFGPYLLSSLFNQQNDFSPQIAEYFETHINQSKFLHLITKGHNELQPKQRYRKALESLACSLIVGNEEIVDKNYQQYMSNTACTQIEATTLAYTLLIQKYRNWNQFDKELVLDKFRQKLKENYEQPKYLLLQLQQQLFLSDMILEFPQFAEYQNGLSFGLELPLDFFVDSNLSNSKTFFLEDDLFIDLKINNQVFSFLYVEEFETSPLRTFFLRYVKLYKLQQRYPDLKVVWCHRLTPKEDILKCIEKL